ncbi:winged helix-turn-helix transcriptional regulator [Streptomyces sp. CAI-121]|uniref:MarR family winged helix-turn-helix transcriptional regulator n=1 Tax=unclassified Streptomyces TaxID=2593676 RepID=UPI0015876415|nr:MULTISPECIES: MarR family winged helix-turn-helix transcriptional regulator [unclassified Streptomyces]NUV67603.1 winged helix-turn-helix transcriptional regulator [Streptomyces sp. CAI-121]NUW13721.1 winged helix-turn-helix transcriptional regulator [Streptomyces sp. CAI-68]
MNATPRGLTPKEQAAWDGFIRAQEKLIGRLSRYVQADSGMSAADFIVLAELTEAGGRMRFMDLAKLVEWEKSRMSHQVGRMAKRGLVAREDCPDDGRGSFIVATPAGCQAIEGAAPLHVEHVRRLFIDALTEDELDALTRISGRVVAHLEGHPDGG